MIFQLLEKKIAKNRSNKFISLSYKNYTGFGKMLRDFWIKVGYKTKDSQNNQYT